MSELFPMFDESPTAQPPASSPLIMTAAQREEIKALFAQLGVTTARDQFTVIEELTGTRIRSVSELSAAHAHRAVAGLTRRVASLGETRTGNAWDDRESPTWIDRL